MNLYSLFHKTALLAVIILLAGCSEGTGGKEQGETGAGGQGTKRPRVAFVTNGIANFWTIAETGAEKAGEDFGCDVEVRMPPREGGRAANQKRMLEQLISMGVDGIAVSPVDPANQTDILNEVGNQCHYITHDSDAPDSNRLLYIGMSNYDAGRMAGQLVKKAIPDGGNIVIFIGSLEQHNAKLRRQGLIDEVLDRSHDPTRYDQPGSEISEGNYTFLATRVDDFDDTRKKELPQQALAKYVEDGKQIDCMVGLFEYNPPFIFDALESAGKLGEIKVVGFDENERTLEEIKTGNCVGTVVQNPYMYGYKSVEVLQRLAQGDKSDLESDFIDIPARMIEQDNVEAFQKELAAMIAGEAN
ncbi:MAG: sugar-binding protein [Pirellulaceae bacterium]